MTLTEVFEALSPGVPSGGVPTNADIHGDLDSIYEATLILSELLRPDARKPGVMAWHFAVSRYLHEVARSLSRVGVTLGECS